jgi:hypothetical protein
VDGIFATPNPDVVCVVSAGAGYWVDTVEHNAIDVPAFPIRQIEIADGILVFADFTKLVAYNSRGLAWNSGHIVSDHLRITRVDSNQLECTGWDASRSAEVIAKFDLLTGKRCSPN